MVKCSSVVGVASLESPFSRSEYFNVVLRPGEDVAGWRFAIARRQVVDLGGGKFPIPDI